MVTEISNRELIELLQQGQDWAYEYLYKQYYNRLCAFSSQYVPVWEAEEIVHDTMMWIWENRTTLIPELQIKSLLFTIVKNKSLNQVKHNKIKSEVLSEIKAKFAKEFEDPDFYIYADLKEKFKKALDKLPEDCREAFILNRFENKSYQEIAEMKHVSTKTVAYRIGKALKILRIELQHYLELLLLLHII